MTWTGSQYVAVGAKGNILFSTNGNTWTQQFSGSSETLIDVIASAKQIVAVGGSGTVLSSGTRAVFSSLPSISSNTLWGVTTEDSKFVAVGEDGAIWTSPDSLLDPVPAMGPVAMFILIAGFGVVLVFASRKTG